MPLLRPNQYLIGFLTAILAAIFIRWIIETIKHSENYKDIDGKWTWAFRTHLNNSSAAKTLGFLEVVLFFIAFSMNKPELIAGWLAFKLTSKWQAWSSIVKTPEKIDGIDAIHYLGVRNRVATYTLQRWLVGTLANILGGAVAFICALHY